jgi:hypothetical protein
VLQELQISPDRILGVIIQNPSKTMIYLITTKKFQSLIHIQVSSFREVPGHNLKQLPNTKVISQI